MYALLARHLVRLGVVKRSRPLPLFLALALASSTFSTVSARRAFADEPSRAQLQAARELFLDATHDEEASRWAVALEKLHRVEEVKVTAGIRYHVALCEERLGQTSKALAHYNEALQLAHDEKNKEVIELLKERFLSELRDRVPTLAIDVPAADGAEVTLDGQVQSHDAWGKEAPVDPGVHRVEARAPGRRAFAALVTLNERDRARVTVALPLIPIEVVTPAAPPAPPKPMDAPKPHGPNRAGAIAATAGALALVGGGIAAYAIADSNASDARAECASALRECDHRETTIRLLDGVALGAWIGAAALGTVAVLLWTSHGSGRETSLGVGPGSLRLQGSF